MTQPLNLPIQGLDFDEIKANFIQFLKNDGAYTDYNFEGSGINALLNIFAFDAHYIGFYVKMLLGESFIDSATKRETLLGKAKLNGYLPKNKRSARASLKLITTMEPAQEPLSKSLTIPRGSSFIGRNIVNDSRVFYVLDSVTCYDREEVDANTVKYTSPEFAVFEGKFRTWRFKVNNAITNQRFIIDDSTIDLDSIRITVFDDENEEQGVQYLLATNLFEITANSNVFYLSTNEQGLYEIFFGNNQFGTQPAHNQIIYTTYLSSSGAEGNGCKTLTYQKPAEDLETRQTTGSFDDFEVEMTHEVSFGGLGEESLETIRFNIPNHYRAQGRTVTEEDYKAVLFSNFRDIDGINVWGGEKNYYKDFGSVYVSIKPKYSKTLSGFAKEEIQSILETYGVVGTRIKVQDPDYIDVDIEVHVKYDKNITDKSAGEIEQEVINSVAQYNEENLNNFNTGLSDVDLLQFIKTQTSSITRIYSKKVLNKTIRVIYDSSTENLVLFGNAIVAGSVYSSEFTYGTTKCLIKDDGLGELWVYDTNNIKMIDSTIGTIDYENGVIKFILEIDFVSDFGDDGESGEIIFSCSPTIPDINTYLNNIVNIQNTVVFIS